MSGRARIGMAASLLAAGAAAVLGASCGSPTVAADGEREARQPVSAREATFDGERDCDYISLGDLEPSGGCVARADGSLRFEMVTPFGAFPVATCDYGYTLRSDASGVLWADYISGSGSGSCGDVRACRTPGALSAAPWSGRLVADAAGTFHTVMDACFDTCFGVFEGKLDLKLRRNGRQWALIADRARVGQSGLVLNGSLTMQAPTLRLEARRAAS